MTVRPTVRVVGLGPGGPDLVTAGTRAAIEASPVRFVRTWRHPSAEVVGVPDGGPMGSDDAEGAERAGSSDPGSSVTSFDEVYESAGTLDEVYPAIVERLVAAARDHGEVLYAVPGSPVVAERTVELLVADERVDVVVVPALSFLDLAWVRLGVDPVALGVRVVDGHRFEAEAAGERGPLLVAQCDSAHVLSDVKLALADAIDRAADLGGGLARLATAADGTDVPGAGRVGDDLEVTVVQRLGLPDEAITVVPWPELDRVDADHLTSLWIPELAAPVAGAVQRFTELVATLRAECPWDREQTHHSLRRHLLEEAYEVLEALDHLPPDEVAADDERVDGWVDEAYLHLEEELGDLLFQIVLHATLAAEEGRFTLADVATTVTEKLRARHPHVFGGAEAGSAEEVAATWEQAKKAEKGRASVFDGIPDALPALLFALKVQKKAATLDLGDAGPSVPPLDEALAAVRSSPGESTVGDLLLAVVAEARTAGIDPENALRSRATAWRDHARIAEP